MAATEREVLLEVQRALSEEQFQTFKYLLEERLPLSRLQPDAVGWGSGWGTRSEPAGRAPHPPLMSPWVSPGGGRLLSERDLLRVAQLLGHEWQEVGVLCLGLQRCRLEQIRENNPHRTALCSFEMLREWRRREGAAATAPRLRDCLRPAQLDPEVFTLLQQMGLE
uniref:Death domain-containing protein n=1 Tax=Pavo cristatus TaxID=9049 RepID=A0A8C9EQ93_PAVCR